MGVISVPMAICTDGLQLSATGPLALDALSAAAAKCASTTPWPPRLPQLQLSGTMKSMMVHQTMWFHKAISPLLGSAVCVATTGVQHQIIGFIGSLAAKNAAIVQRPGGGSSTQPLQKPRTLEQELA